MSEPFIAEIKIFAGNFAPRGYSFCDGQLLPVSQNTALFSLIGTTYGGDGRTTFALPNLQGRVPMHPGRGPGLTSRRLGEQVGAKTEVLQEAEMPSHSHAAHAFPGADSATADANHGLGAVTMYANGSANVSMAATVVGSAGVGQAHNNVQPILTLNFIIALTGLYPSRS